MGESSVDLLQLQYFRVVARVQHMTRAATELAISQPSLSKMIRRLEDELGIPLFEREGRAIRLNQFGHVWLEHVERLLNELDEGKRTLRDMAGLEAGDVKVVTASLSWLPDVLERFHTAYPSVRFQLVQRPLAEMLRLLETGTWDFGFLSIPLHQLGIVWQPLRTEEMGLIVPARHRLAERQQIALTEVANEAMIMETGGSGMRSLTDTFCSQAGFMPRIVYEIDDPSMIVAFVRANLGIAFAPALLQRQLSDQGDQAVRFVRLSEPYCQHTFGMAWRAGHYLSQAARAFQHFVLTYFRVQQPALAKEG